MRVRIVGTQLSDPGPVGARKPLLVLGPSLGTSVHALWAPCVRDLADRFHLVGWDLPGHGASPAANGSAIDFTDLAAAVIDLVDAVQEERGEPIGSFAYAGDSASGAVGLQLLLDAPDRVRAAVILCSSAAFGVMPGWLDRAAAARASGTAALVPLSLQRWFTDGFAEREPERVSALLHSLRETDDESYAQVCEALSRFDVRDRLSDVTVPLLAVAGSEDVATPPALLEEIAAGIPGTRLVVLDGVAHLPPAEAPSVVVKLLAQHLEPHEESATGIPHVVGDDAGDPLYDKGMTVRRAVLGDAHVDRANAGVTDLTRDFQELDHALRLGLHLDAAGPRPTEPLDDHPHRAHRSRSPRGAGDAPSSRTHQRADRRRDQRGHPPERDLLRRPGRQHRLPSGADRSLGTRSNRGAVLMTHHTGESAYVYAAVRTPFGKFNGGLSGVRPDDLAATAMRGVLATLPDLDPQDIGDVVWGNANGAGEDNRNVGRMAVLLSGLPVTLPATTVNRLCGSSLDAAMIGSRTVESGDADIVLVGGVESMTRAPWVLPKPARPFPAGDMTAVSTTLGWRLVNPSMPAEWTASLGSATNSCRRSSRSRGSDRTRSRCGRTSSPTRRGTRGSTTTRPWPCRGRRSPVTSRSGPGPRSRSSRR